MRWSFGRLSPPMLVALLTTVFILVGFLIFLFAAARSRNVSVTVSEGPTPTPLTVVVTVPAAVSTAPATLAPPPTATSAPLVTVPPAPTATPPPPTATPLPTPAPTPAAPPAPAPPAPPAPTSVIQPAAQPAPPTQAGEATQPVPPGSAPAPAAPNPPPAQAALAAAVQPAPPGGFGNTRADFTAKYGDPAGRTADGLDVYLTDRAELNVGFDNDRAALLKLALREGKVMSIEEARDLARGLSPRDAQPVASIGQDVGRPVDEFRSPSLATVFDVGVFRGAPPGTFSVFFTPAPQQRYSGFQFQLGPPGR